MMTDDEPSSHDERLGAAAAHERIAQWSGQAEQYDTHRPSGPAVLPPLLTQLAEAPRPALVVDLGCGTGLSTLLWADAAQQVIGVEPNDDMRQRAERRLAHERPDASHIRFIGATAHQTGLPDGCADIVTASQAFHWMEPTTTLAEIARILRRGGVFAAYDYQWPPTITWQTDALFHDFMDRAFGIAESRGYGVIPPGWDKAGHLERMRASGQFRQVKENALHNVEPCDAGRFIGMTMSNAIEWMLARGEVTADEIGLEAFERAAREAIPTPMRWYVSYHVRLGVK